MAGKGIVTTDDSVFREMTQASPEASGTWPRPAAP